MGVLKFVVGLLLSWSAVTSAQAGWVFVDSWDVHSGPAWGQEPQIYTGQEAAALLFGGSASDYAISTNGSDPNQINHSAWVSAWGQGYSGEIVAEDLRRDLNGDGLYNCCDGTGAFGEPGDYSAFVRDWCFEGGCINYAFRQDGGRQVPEPGTLALVSLAVGGAFALRRRRQAG